MKCVTHWVWQAATRQKLTGLKEIKGDVFGEEVIKFRLRRHRSWPAWFMQGMGFQAERRTLATKAQRSGLFPEERQWEEEEELTLQVCQSAATHKFTYNWKVFTLPAPFCVTDIIKERGHIFSWLSCGLRTLLSTSSQRTTNTIFEYRMRRYVIDNAMM